MIIHTLLITHTHTYTHWHFETLTCRQGLRSLFSSHGMGMCFIESSNCLVCHVNSFLEKLMCGKNVVPEAHLRPCQSAAQVDETKLCFYLFFIPGLCQGWREAENTFVLFLFYTVTPELEQQKRHNELRMALVTTSGVKCCLV